MLDPDRYSNIKSFKAKDFYAALTTLEHESKLLLSNYAQQCVKFESLDRDCERSDIDRLGLKTKLEAAEIRVRVWQWTWLATVLLGTAAALLFMPCH